MNTNNVNSPKRRFRSFEGEWEQRKLGNIASMHARIGWQNLRTSEFLDNGDYYLITGTDFLNGRINFEKCHYVNKERYQQDKKIQVGKGSILITKDGTLGKVALVTDLNKPATLNAGVFNVVVKVPSINETYLYQYLAAPFLMDYVSKRATGGTIKHLNQGILVEFPVDIPSYKEQVTIGQFLVCLDNAVTLHQHKLDKLKNLKKAYLSEMFPAEGERVPKRRFPGFEGEWEHKKLGQLMDVGSVKRVHQSDWRDRGVRFLRARDIVSESKNKKPDDFLYIDEELYKKYSAISGMVEKGDLLVTGVGTIGVPMLVESSEPLYFKDGNIIWFKNKNLLDGHFFYYSFTARAIQKFIGDVAGVGTVGTYTIDSGKNTPIILPVTKEEQVVIGNFFKKLDQSITLQQQKLDKLNDLKKAYLSELFV